jgi:hypothetical protein
MQVPHNQGSMQKVSSNMHPQINMYVFYHNNLCIGCTLLRFLLRIFLARCKIYGLCSALSTFEEDPCLVPWDLNFCCLNQRTLTFSCLLQLIRVAFCLLCPSDYHVFCHFLPVAPVRIRVRVDPPYPHLCRKRRLIGAALRMRLEKPRSHVTAGVAR